MTPQQTEILTRGALQLGIAACFTWWLVRSLRRSGLSGWWVLPALLIAWLFKWYIGVPLIIVLLFWLGRRAPSEKPGIAFRFGERLSRSVLGLFINKRAKLQAPEETLRSDVVSMKVAVGLIVVTAVGTYVIAHPRRHHFEQAKGGDGAILLDTDTGVLCSARVGMKRTDADEVAVQAAALVLREANAHYESSVTHNFPPAGELATKDFRWETCDGTCVSFLNSKQDAESNYNALVQKANDEQVPDMNTSGIKSLPLCKDLR